MPIVRIGEKTPAIVVLAAMLVSACGGGGVGHPSPSPQSNFDLQTAVAALVKSGLTASVSLSGTVIVNGTSNPVTGTGTLTLSPGTSGLFNNVAAQLQTQSLSGTITVAGQNAPYSSSVVNAYEPATAAILGESQHSEFDVAQAPIAIPQRSARPSRSWER